MHDLNIVSVNVRGLNSVEKRSVFYKWLEQNNFDVVLLQETHYVEKFKEKYDFIGMVSPFIIFQIPLIVEGFPFCSERKLM